MGLTQNEIDLDKFIFNPSSKKITLTEQEQEYLRNNRVIKMCNNPNWEPIEFAEHGDMNAMAGIAIDTIHEIEKNSIYDFKLSILVLGVNLNNI